jgi:hypothetical protein
MSEEPQEKKARFLASPGDPGRARNLEREEYARAVADLHAVVIPIMEKTAATLRERGFCTVSVESRGAMVSLVAGCERADLKGTLRFQIHESFAVLVTRDPVFWMFTLFSGGDMLLARPGRLPGLEPVAEIEKIIEDFGSACELGLRSHAEKVGAYLNDAVTWALDGERLQPPDAAGELLRFSTCGEKAYLPWAVVPVLEAAHFCLERRFPEWGVRVFPPVKGDDSRCGMVIDTNFGKWKLLFYREIPADEAPVLCYQVIRGGIESPPEPLEIITNESGHFVTADSIEAIVGEFIYGLAAAWQAVERLE